MPGLVTPPEAPAPRVAVPGGDDPQIGGQGEVPESTRRPKSPVPKKASGHSPSTSRANPGADGSASGRWKSSPGDKVARLDEPALDNPDLGPFLLKLARDTIVSGDTHGKALEYAIRASKSFERRAVSEGGEAQLGMAMSLHVTAAIYCGLGRFEEAAAELERAVQVPDVEKGADHALAIFSGYMQLGDTYSMMGRVDRSIACYTDGLRIQTEALGETDLRVAETCRYVAEAYVQAMQFDEAEELCRKTLEIHRQHSARGSLEEAADRRLMALICEAKGDYDAALEHLVLASMTMIENKRDDEVAAIDVGIGDIYQILGRYDEATFAYQKALTVFKSTKGDDHPSVASIFVRLADLYHKTGKFRESKAYCENALRIYAKPVPGTPEEEIAGGLVEVSAIYEAANEPEEALKLIQKALQILEDSPGQRSSIAGIEAQRGVLYYVVGRYAEARNSFEGALSKLRVSGEKKSAFFGVVLNQMGLACVQLYKIDEAAGLFEEAKGILEKACGPYHQDTLGVCSNLAATYDALGRVDDAIDILEHVLKAREERLGTANPDADDEKRRLAELLKDAGKARSRRANSLDKLIGNGTKSQGMKKEGGRKWSGWGFRSLK